MIAPLGLFGGSFDPVHIGHLRLAAELREALRLARVVFLPAGHSWQRAHPARASAGQRLKMIELAIAGDPAFSVDDRELRRVGPTYSLDTLREYRRECGPAAPLVFLCGADAFARVDTWHRWESLFELAHFAVALRADDRQWHSRECRAIPEALLARSTADAEDIAASPAGRIITLAMTPLAISSTAIRDLAQARRSIRYLTPDAVVDYIHQHQLYGARA